MPGFFNNYKAIVLDSTFYVREFPYYVRDGLMGMSVYVSATFNSEIRQNQTILSPAKNKIYNENINFINSNIKIKTLNLSSFGEAGQNVNNDTWGLINILAQNKANFLIITADSILIQRIIMKNLQADIYDLNSEALFAYNKFSEYRQMFELNNDTRSVFDSAEDIHISENSVLFLNSGGTIQLGEEINSGLEGRLFRVADNPGFVAKVFKKDKLPLNKFINISKLQGINSKMDISWALFPVETLFYDEAHRFPAGFIESYINTKGNLDDDPLYLGDIDLSDSHMNKRLSSSINICLKVARQVKHLNTYGFLVSDYNMGNFSADNPSSPFIQMWDTDSFGRENFFSGYCSGCKTSREYDISKKEGAIDFCNEALYQFVFSVISLGDTPISEFSGKFKYDNPNYGALYRKRLFPADLWSLFEDVFRGNKLPSTEILILNLQKTLNLFNENPHLDRTYKELLKDMLSSHPEDSSQAQGYNSGILEYKQDGQNNNQSISDTHNKNNQNRNNQQIINSDHGNIPYNYQVPPEKPQGLPAWAKALIAAGVSAAVIALIIIIVVIIFTVAGQ